MTTIDLRVLQEDKLTFVETIIKGTPHYSIADKSTRPHINVIVWDAALDRREPKPEQFGSQPLLLIYNQTKIPTPDFEGSIKTSAFRNQQLGYISYTDTTPVNIKQLDEKIRELVEDRQTRLRLVRDVELYLMKDAERSNSGISDLLSGESGKSSKGYVLSRDMDITTKVKFACKHKGKYSRSLAGGISDLLASIGVLFLIPGAPENTSATTIDFVDDNDYTQNGYTYKRNTIVVAESHLPQQVFADTGLDAGSLDRDTRARLIALAWEVVMEQAVSAPFYDNNGIGDVDVVELSERLRELYTSTQ